GECAPARTGEPQQQCQRDGGAVAHGYQAARAHLSLPEGSCDTTLACSRPLASRTSISSSSATCAAEVTSAPSRLRVTTAKPRSSVARGLTACRARDRDCSRV